jgi:citronellol/citronellal dehydrogenase
VELSNKVAIVTGSSRGIGRAIAIGFAKEGAGVVIAARTETDSENMPGTIYKTAEEIQALGCKALPVKCNVADEESVNNMLRKALEQFGQIDILVNNAGIAYYAPVLETPVKRWELVIRVNLIGTLLCTKAVLPQMVERRQGSIINISSVSATDRGPSITGVAYGVSKAGIERFTWGLATEVGKYNIAVNAVKPSGVVNTEGMRFMLKDVDKSQWVSSDMMVKAAIFLAAQDATGTTGVVAYDEEICAWHGLT